jgi:hydrogenase maturation protease
MIDDLRDMLAPLSYGPTAFLGIGNTDRSDDGAGVLLAQLLIEHGVDYVFIGRAQPEKSVPELRDGNFDTVVFLDAVDFQAEPGAVALLDANQIAGRYPQVSTHKLSMGTLAHLVANTTTRAVWLLGIQPVSIALGAGGLSGPVEKTLHMLAHTIADMLSASPVALQEHLCT